MPPSSRARFSRSGFTLIELLTVIAIIAILMALLLPALSGARNAARKGEARNDLTQFVAAVKNYDSDYGVYPVDPTLGTSADLEYGSPSAKFHNSVVVDTLMGDGSEGDANQNNAINYKGTSYLDVPLVKDASNPKEGLIATSGGNYIRHDWVDPWGGTYVVDIDANYDGYIDGASMSLLKYNDVNYDQQNGASVVQTGCIAGSLGADHQFGTAGSYSYKNSDDVLSWQ